MVTPLYDTATTAVNTTESVADDGLNFVAVYGLPGYRFYLIHITGLTSLCTSLITSTSVLIYLLMVSTGFKAKPIYNRPIGERLVIYLATFDTLYSICHIMDHSYMLAVTGHPPDAACIYFGFNLNQFVIGQALIVIFTSVNAFIMVVKERKINLGKYDWKLLAYAMGIPLVVGIVGVATGHFGPTGIWCYIDMRKPAGPILTNVVAAVMILTFVFNLICYGAVYFKIQQVAKKMAGSSKGGGKYHKTAKVMMLFVAVYMGQWWAYIILSITGLFTDPHISIMWASVFFSNMGGVFNFIAYSFVRKKQSSVSDAPPPSSNRTQLRPAGIKGKQASAENKNQLKPVQDTTSTTA